MQHEPAPAPPTYAGGVLLARNTALNLVGHGAPLIVALFAIPALLAHLGTERFGVLTIAWAFIGYFSLFDFGMSRALTQLVSERLGTGQDREVPRLVWTALFLMLLMGLLGGGITVLLAPWLVNDALTVPPPLRADTLRAFYALAASIPVVISTAALRGVLEARQRFDLINAIRIPMGIFTFAGPLAVLPFHNSLFAIVLTLLGGRILAWFVHLHYGLASVQGLYGKPSLDWRLAGPLLRFGGWMTVSNVVGPIMVYLDRFLIGAVLSVTAVAYYATPLEVVTKLFLIPSAVSGVLFPAIGFWYRRDPRQAARLGYSAIKFITLMQFPLILAIVLFARPGLTLWLGQAFGDAGFRPMQILAIGVLLNGMAVPPFAVLQGLGRPDLTAKVHLIELPLYLLALWPLVQAWGIIGAAVAWLLRIFLDLCLLFALSSRFLPRSPELTKLYYNLGLSTALLGLAMLPSSLLLQVPMFVLFLLGYAAFAWGYLLDAREKQVWHHGVVRRLRWAGEP